LAQALLQLCGIASDHQRAVALRLHAHGVDLRAIILVISLKAGRWILRAAGAEPCLPGVRSFRANCPRLVDGAHHEALGLVVAHRSDRSGQPPHAHAVRHAGQPVGQRSDAHAQTGARQLLGTKLFGHYGQTLFDGKGLVLGCQLGSGEAPLTQHAQLMRSIRRFRLPFNRVLLHPSVALCQVQHGLHIIAARQYIAHSQMEHFMEKRLGHRVGVLVSRSDDHDPALFWQRRSHYTFRRPDPSLFAPPHDVDWWRVPEPRQGLLHKLLHLFRR
jgi:hypothetical protein